MQWLNEPAAWSEEGARVTVHAGAKTDFWRVTLHNFIADNAPFYFQSVTGDFTATVKVTGDYGAIYDQAGLMVRESETVWLKCGIEFVEGVQYASAVITRDYSDWSIVPVPDNPGAVWVRVKRTGAAVEVYFSRDGVDFTLIRQGYLTTAPIVQVGIMCAAPQGDGFEAVFEDYRVDLSTD